MSNTHELWLQISAGQGPAECAWAVVKTVEAIETEARSTGFASCTTVEIEPGPQPGTAQSALVSIDSAQPLTAFAQSWAGTVKWIARSPFRPEHKRKNWFVGVEVLQPFEETRMQPSELRWDTMRASGPGGQHVNRTESAVRVTHIPTGIQVVAMEERSQHRNRKLALARLVAKVDSLNASRHGQSRQERWRAHHDLERGNPVRVFRPGL